MCAKSTCRVYNGVPFIREMRQLLDWITANTSLQLDEWMVFESMYTDLFLSVNSFRLPQAAARATVCREDAPSASTCVNALPTAHHDYGLNTSAYYVI